MIFFGCDSKRKKQTNEITSKSLCDKANTPQSSGAARGTGGVSVNPTSVKGLIPRHMEPWSSLGFPYCVLGTSVEVPLAVSAGSLRTQVR